MYKKILCPIDGSETSDCGMAEAIHLAKDQQAELRFLHVVDNSALVMYMPVPGDAFELLRENGRKILAQAVSAARAQGIMAESKIAEIMVGRVAAVIVEEAVEFAPDLIVMGTHGRRGISRLLMGSDAATVVGTTAVPVLLVKCAPE
jgi:nucleotide-binding universal stress UspA family protein